MKDDKKSHKELALSGLEEMKARIAQLEPGVHKRLLFAHAQGVADEVTLIQELQRPRRKEKTAKTAKTTAVTP